MNPRLLVLLRGGSHPRDREGDCRAAVTPGTGKLNAERRADIQTRHSQTITRTRPEFLRGCHLAVEGVNLPFEHDIYAHDATSRRTTSHSRISHAAGTRSRSQSAS